MNLSVFATGEKVTMYCKKRDGVFVLAAMKSERASVTGDGTGNTTPPAGPTTSAGTLVEGAAGSVSVKLEDGSTVSCKTERPAPAGLFKPGDKVKVTCAAGALTGIRSDAGSWNPISNEVGISGLLTAGSGGTATVQREGVTISCALATGVDLTTTVALGTKVWMSCRVKEGSLVFVLVQVGDTLTVKGDGSAERYAAGKFTERGTESVTITREDGTTLSCAAPASVDLSAFHTGDKVKVKCRLKTGVWRLSMITNGTTTVEVPL